MLSGRDAGGWVAGGVHGGGQGVGGGLEQVHAANNSVLAQKHWFLRAVPGHLCTFFGYRRLEIGAAGNSCYGCCSARKCLIYKGVAELPKNRATQKKP